MNPFAAAVFFLIVAFSSCMVEAQTMYRCGSNYQDKPCANGQTGKVVNTLKSPTPRADADATGATVTIDASCKRRSDEAQKIIWAREGGAQKKDMLAKADSEEQSKLISDVYAVRGNSNDVRANIEKDCMAEKDLSKRLGFVPDAALIKAAREVQQKMSATEKTDSLKKDIVIEAEAAAPKKRQSCPSLKLQLEIVNTNVRAGVDQQSSQQFKQQKRDLEKEMAANGCQN